MKSKNDDKTEVKGFNRRQFIYTSLLAVSTSLLSNSIFANSSSIKKDKYSYGATSELPKRKLGTLEVSALGSGCMNFVANS